MVLENIHGTCHYQNQNSFQVIMCVQCYLIWSFPLEAYEIFKQEHKLETPIHKIFSDPGYEKYKLNKN